MHIYFDLFLQSSKNSILQKKNYPRQQRVAGSGASPRKLTLKFVHLKKNVAKQKQKKKKKKKKKIDLADDPGPT
jgi:hypothetical protein